VNSFSLITSYIVRLVDMTLPLLPDPIGYEQIDASPKFALTPIRPSHPPITYEEEDSDDEADYDSEDDTEEVEFIPVTVVVVPIIPPPSRAQLEWNTLMKCPSWDQLLTYRVRDPGVLVQYTRLRSSRRKDPVHLESGRGRLNRAGSMLVTVLNREPVPSGRRSWIELMRRTGRVDGSIDTFVPSSRPVCKVPQTSQYTVTTSSTSNS
jgi:hypothetical protein